MLGTSNTHCRFRGDGNPIACDPAGPSGEDFDSQGKEAAPTHAGRGKDSPALALQDGGDREVHSTAQELAIHCGSLPAPDRYYN
jgi:hypothetical protein